jgi:hypothetical protein
VWRVAAVGVQEAPAEGPHEFLEGCPRRARACARAARRRRCARARWRRGRARSRPRGRQARRGGRGESPRRSGGASGSSRRPSVRRGPNIRTLRTGWAYGAVYRTSSDRHAPSPAGSPTLATDHTKASAAKRPRALTHALETTSSGLHLAVYPHSAQCDPSASSSLVRSAPSRLSSETVEYRGWCAGVGPLRWRRSQGRSTRPPCSSWAGCSGSAPATSFARRGSGPHRSRTPPDRCATRLGRLGPRRKILRVRASVDVGGDGPTPHC